ncbi:MAG: hypothetical protein ACOY41_09895 [Pseudomonadota bacterium]
MKRSAIRERRDTLARVAVKAASLAEAFELLAALPDDFMSEGRHNPPPQARDEL